MDGLRKARLDAGLSQEALARRAQCSTTSVKLAEHGYRVSDEMAARIAAALGLDPEALR